MGVIDDHFRDAGMSALENEGTVSKIEGVVADSDSMAVPSGAGLQNFIFFKLEGVEQDHYFAVPSADMTVFYNGVFVVGYVPSEEPNPVDGIPNITTLPVMKMDIWDKRDGHLLQKYIRVGM